MGPRFLTYQYADDLCILGDTAEDLQKGLDGLTAYCKQNHIEINVAKTKIQVFHRGKLPECEFILDNQPVELVNNFTYLGFNFSVQLSFSHHAKVVNSKARSKCGLLYSSLPMSNLPLPLILQLFEVFVLPTLSYGLSMWLPNCSASSLQAVDATYTKYLKRYLQVPVHSNNNIVYFLTSTTPLSLKLKDMATHNNGALTFPSELHGHKVSFLSLPPNPITPSNFEMIPSWFWMSRIFHSLPTNPKSRRSLCREILDSDHFHLCSVSSFHTSPSLECTCTHCGDHAHVYHVRFCEAFTISN